MLDTQHVKIETSSYANFWDDGAEGNYWDNYTRGDPDHDGIGNSPYVVEVGNTDNCPLMGIFTSFSKLGSFGYVVSNSTIEQFRYFESNCTIRIHVSNMTTSQIIGFCRICIPHALLYEPYNVTVNGAGPLHVDHNLADNETHRWIYFNYEHSLLTIIIAPELPSTVILPLSMISTLMAVMAYRRKQTGE